MDVLFLMKSEHDLIRGQLQEFESSKTAKAAKKAFESLEGLVGYYLTLEKDYIYPEIIGLFSGAERLVERGLCRQKEITDRMIELSEVFSKKSAKTLKSQTKAFSELTREHLEILEERLMPELRSRIDTSDREDLGQVFLDVKQEWSSAAIHSS